MIIKQRDRYFRKMTPVRKTGLW